MNTQRNRFFAIVSVLVLISGNGLAQDIVNPVPGYRKLPRESEQQPDSVKSLDVFFEQLPRFGETTPVLVTYYSQFSSEAGVEISAQNANSTTKEVSPFVEFIPGPVQAGDTVRARFEFTPRAVGYLELKFIAYDPTNKNVKAPVKVGGWVRADLVLSPSGETVALGSPAANGANHALLGPDPELLTKGVVFAIDPKPPVELRPPDYDEYLESQARHLWYDVRLEAVAGSETGSLDIRGTVSPYHAFVSGIGIEIQHTENLEVTKVPKSIDGPVVKFGTYDFEMSVRSKGKSKIEPLSVCFVTPNPDLGNVVGTFSGMQSSELKKCMSLYIGFDDYGRLLFVTHRDVWSDLQRQKTEKSGALLTDDRIDQVAKLGRPPRPREKTYSENYSKVISIDSVKQ